MFIRSLASSDSSCCRHVGIAVAAPQFGESSQGACIARADLRRCQGLRPHPLSQRWDSATFRKAFEKICAPRRATSVAVREEGPFSWNEDGKEEAHRAAGLHGSRYAFSSPVDRLLLWSSQRRPVDLFFSCRVRSSHPIQRREYATSV